METKTSSKHGLIDESIARQLNELLTTGEKQKRMSSEISLAKRDLATFTNELKELIATRGLISEEQFVSNEEGFISRRNKLVALSKAIKDD